MKNTEKIKNEKINSKKLTQKNKKTIPEGRKNILIFPIKLLNVDFEEMRVELIGAVSKRIDWLEVFGGYSREVMTIMLS